MPVSSKVVVFMFAYASRIRIYKVNYICCYRSVQLRCSTRPFYITTFPMDTEKPFSEALPRPALSRPDQQMRVRHKTSMHCRRIIWRKRYQISEL